jgi:pantoate--beta-alanine ligase
MYPEGFATTILTGGPASVGLEDRFRPHFFGGVSTVVGKLFTQCRPDFAIFGEKDFQQLRVIVRMARDLDLGVRVLGSRTVRERDGLAMSSRNVNLSPEERRVAPELLRAMKESGKRLRAGEDIQAAMAGGAELITAAGFKVDYFEVRHAETLAPIVSVKDGPMRILVAARIGKTRLIDNLGVLPGELSRSRAQQAISDQSSPRSRSSRRIGSGIEATLAAAAFPRSGGAASSVK